ncbi:MAG: hypothetical protein ACLUHE_08975 [Christensenellales bacterium]
MKKYVNAYRKVEEFLLSFLCGDGGARVQLSAIARGIGKPPARSLRWRSCCCVGRALSARTLRSATINAIGLDLLTRKCRRSVQKVLEIVVLVLMQAAFCIFIYYGVMLSISAGSRSFQTLLDQGLFVCHHRAALSCLALMTLTVILAKSSTRVKNFKKERWRLPWKRARHKYGEWKRRARSYC